MWIFHYFNTSHKCLLCYGIFSKYEVPKVVDCEKQNYAPEGEPLHQIVDEFADHQDIWFRVSRYFYVMMLFTTCLIFRIISLLLKKCWRMVTIPRIWLRGLRSGLAQFVPKIGKLVEVENLFGDVNNLISRFSLKLKFYFPFMGTLTSTRP